MRHVLLCLDQSPCSENALPHAVALAKACGARMTVVHTLESADFERMREPIDALGWEIARGEARRYLDRVRERVTVLGVTCESVLAEGNAAEQILRLEQSLEIDLIALATHGSHGVSTWNLGSTAEKIVAHTHASLLLVPARRDAHDAGEATCRCLLVPLDGSLRSECALPPALRVARSHGSKLILAHVVTVPEMFRPEAMTEADRALVESLARRNEELASAYMSDLRSRLGDEHLEIETVVVRGNDVFRSLLELVEREQVGLVSLAAHGAGSATHHARGNVARQFVVRTVRPVLIVQDLSHAELESALATDSSAVPTPRLGGLHHEVLP